jgi:hypothetical protein
MTSDFHTPRPYIHIAFLASSLKKEADETLFLELARRGYDLSRLRENTEENAEIVKVG